MTQFASAEVFPAIYAKLAPGGVIDSRLAALGFTGVFNWRAVPEGQPFDYIVIGDAVERPKNTFGRRGYSVSVTIHLWSRQSSSKPSEQAIARINTLLDQKPLTLASQSHIFTMFDQAQMIADMDGFTLHSTLRYQIYTEE